MTKSKQQKRTLHFTHTHYTLFVFLKIENPAINKTTLERFVSDRGRTCAYAIGFPLINFFFFIVRVYNETQ